MKNEFRVRGSNTNQHQAKLQGVGNQNIVVAAMNVAENVVYINELVEEGENSAYKKNEYREKEGNIEENIFMENKSGPVDIAKQYKTKFEVNDYVATEHEVEIYEIHE